MARSSKYRTAVGTELFFDALFTPETKAGRGDTVAHNHLSMQPDDALVTQKTPLCRNIQQSLTSLTAWETGSRRTGGIIADSNTFQTHEPNGP